MVCGVGERDLLRLIVTQLGVLGHPIAHSKSPALHAAAYRALGLDWQYSAYDVEEADLEGFIETLDDGWRGLSLTMPLKRAVLPLLSWSDPLVSLTGGANTVLFDGDAMHGFNTDVYGVWAALSATGHSNFERVSILGGGATAASVIVAVEQLGADQVELLVRTAVNAAPLVALGDRLGLDVTLRALGEPVDADVVVSTLPGGTTHGTQFVGDALLLDVAYDPWPSELASSWNGRVVSGLEMLLHQALAQVSIFTTGRPDGALPDEASILAAMRAAVA